MKHSSYLPVKGVLDDAGKEFPRLFRSIAIKHYEESGGKRNPNKQITALGTLLVTHINKTKTKVINAQKQLVKKPESDETNQLLKLQTEVLTEFLEVLRTMIPGARNSVDPAMQALREKVYEGDGSIGMRLENTIGKALTTLNTDTSKVTISKH